MKKESIIISIRRAVLFFPRKYPHWFSAIASNDSDLLRCSEFLVESLLQTVIDEGTCHTEKLYHPSTITLSNEQEFTFDIDIVREENVLDVFPELSIIEEFVYDEPYHLYAIVPFKDSRIIVREEDWRVLEYYRLTNKVDERTICLQQWSEDPNMINDYVDRLINEDSKRHGKKF